jgi:hypothetical protein
MTKLPKEQKNIQGYYGNHSPCTQEKAVEGLMKYNTTRLRYLWPILI